MPFDKLEETIEKYSNECIDNNNDAIKSVECKKMLLYLQQKMLPKSRNVMFKRWKKNMTGVGFEPTSTNTSELSLTPRPPKTKVLGLNTQ